MERYNISMAIRHSVCSLDCPDTCGLLINVENGIGSKLRGDPQHPITRGFLCGKVAKYLEREYHPGRLLYPLRRTGAKAKANSHASLGMTRWPKSPCAFPPSPVRTAPKPFFRTVTQAPWAFSTTAVWIAVSF